jgi:uncharacterized protein YndB with AHSA1/START domain
MNNHTTQGEFTIERTLPASPSDVYKMFAVASAKEKWFGGPSDGGTNNHTMDFRIGGEEFNRGTFHDGVTHVFKAHYYDIIPEQRIIYSYEMYLDDVRISVSLTTIEFRGDAGTTRLKLHESGVFLDGFDKPEIREQGTKELLTAIEKAL